MVLKWMVIVLTIPLLLTNGDSTTLIYVDATKGWTSILDNTTNDLWSNCYITATGGTITCCGDYKIHTFTSDGTFCVSAGNPAGSDTSRLFSCRWWRRRRRKL
jgi:hypothetical protein